MRALWPAMVSFFLVLAFTTALRPVRDEMGVAGGVKHLPWLFLATLAATLALPLIVGALLTRVDRARLLALFYRGAAFLLGAFALALWLVPTLRVPLSRGLFVFASTCNLLVVSLLWSAMADRLTPGDAARSFGPLAAAGTFGAVLGAAAATALAGRTGPLPVLALAAGLLLLAPLPLRWLPAHAVHEQHPPTTGWHEGLRALMQSRYLQLIGLYVLLFTLTSTIAYVLQARLSERLLSGAAARTAFFARIELWSNLLTLPAQALLAAPLLRRTGPGPCLVVLPLLTLAGLLSLCTWPALSLLLVFQVARRAVDHALNKPARELLFTVVSPTDKYAAKSVIDTFIYRGGDTLGASLATLALPALPLKGALMTTAAPPVQAVAVLVLLCGGWLVVAAALTRAFQRRTE